MSTTSPYEAPTASLESTGSNSSFDLTGPKSVAAGNGWTWIADGFGHFKQNPGPWIGAFLVWFVLIIAMSIIPIIGQLANLLLTYVFISGFILGCKAQTEGEDFQFSHLFAGFSNNTGKLILLSLIYTIAIIAVLAITMGSMYFSMLTGSTPDMATENPMQFLLSVLIAMAIFVPIMMAFWFAPALIVINNVSIGEALKLSFMGCLKNIVPFLIYGIIALVLYIVACIPLLLGLLVLVPSLIASMYTSYRDIFNN